MYCMVTGGYSTLYLRTASRQEKKNKVAILPKLGKHHFKNNSFLSRIDMTLHDNEYETVQYSKQSFESHEELS